MKVKVITAYSRNNGLVEAFEDFIRKENVKNIFNVTMLSGVQYSELQFLVFYE